MKTQTPTKRTARRLAAVLAIVLAFATGGAWAADWTVSGNTTLTVDTTVDALTVEEGVTLDLNGYKLYCTSLAGSGTITSTDINLTTPSGTVTSSPDTLYNSTTPQMLFDNDTGTRALLQKVNLPFAVTYDFGVGAEMTINKYKIYGPSSNPTRGPKVWTLDGSTDGDVWTSLDTQSGVTWSNGQNKDFPFSNTSVYRYYRITITDSSDTSTKFSGPFLELNEIQFFGPGELHVNIPEGGAATVGSLTISGNMKVVMDGDGRLNGVTGIGSDTFPGVLEVNAGTVYVATDFKLGTAADGTLTINGGTVEVNGSKATHIGASSGKTGTVNLNGGILKTKRLVNLTGGTGRVNFDGGTLQANNTDYYGLFGNNVTVTVNAGGGMIDSGNIAVNVPAAISGTGAMTFKGGGTVTLSGAIKYTGGTTVEAGTVVVVPDVAKRTALGAITVTGLENNICEVVRLSGEGTFSAGDLPVDTETVTFSVSPDGKSILAASGLEGPYWIGGSGDLSTAANWSDGVVPTENPTIKWASPITLTNSDGFAPNTFTIPDDSAVVTLAGALTVNCLTNASKLAVASGATLDIAGDLVGYAANNTKPLLYSNEGTVEVGGMVRFRSNCLENRKVSTVCQYAVVTENTTPIIANGIAYHADKQPDGSWYPDYLVANLGSMNNGAGKWVVGADGLSFPVSRQIDYSGFRILGRQNVTLHSSDNWTLDESYRHYGNDLYLRDTATVTIDTTDYNDDTTPRTVTLKGYINAQGSAATPLTITGCGTVVLDSKTANNHTNVVAGAIAVTDGATLQINKDVVVGGEGTISLAAGTTLALPANADRTFTTPDIVPVTLPAEGAATIRIDGERLKSGEDFTVCSLTDLPDGYVLKDHLNITGTALNGRKYEVKTVEVTENETTVTKLVLNIKPLGLTVIFR